MENRTTSNTTTVVNSVLNILSFLADLIALLICSALLCMALYHLIRLKHHRHRLPPSVSLILSINTLCIIAVKSILQITHVTIPTFGKDFQSLNHFTETLLHRVRAYILWSTIGVLYWSYVLLAFFRFVRVIHPTQLYLHRSSLFLYLLIPAQVIVVFLAMLPLLVPFDGIHMLPNEAYCSITIKPIYLLMYSSVITFGIPYSILSIFYVFIARKISQSSVARVDRNRRDYLVMRRMLVNVILLCIVAVPYVVLYVIDTIRNDFDAVIYRVQWLSSSVTSCLFASMLPMVTTQLRRFLTSNRLTPAHN